MKFKYLLLLFVLMGCWFTINGLAQASTFSKEYFYNVDVTSVYDGDTLTVETEIWPQHTVKTNIRMYGIDTPEKTWRGKCDKEKALALEARNYLIGVIERAKASNEQIYITKIKYDKYARRFVAVLMIGNKNVSQMMINSGYAVEYYGKGTKKDWCL